MKKIESFTEIISDFDGFLFDAYGVLVDDNGLLPGSVELLHQLKGAEKPYLLLSNGSSRTVSDTAQRYIELGLPLTPDQVITSGGMLARFLKDHSQLGEKVAVLGTVGSMALVRECGRIPVTLLDAKGEFEHLVIANQTEYPFLESIDESLSQICRKLDQGSPIKVIVTNPDLFFPKKNGLFGITAGSVVKILEASLEARYGIVPKDLFHGIGKPFSPMFDFAMAKLNSKNLIMVGDQILTDIKGARNAGIYSLLMGTGLTAPGSLKNFPREFWPHYFLESLEVGK